MMGLGGIGFSGATCSGAAAGQRTTVIKKVKSELNVQGGEESQGVISPTNDSKDGS